MNYIEAKINTWVRFHYDEESNMEGLVEIIKENGLKEVTDEKLGCQLAEIIVEIDKNITPEENNGEPTIKVFASDKIIWSNAKKSAL